VTRTATCGCGGLRVTATGEPYGSPQCHCLACQRRRGSPFGVSAYFRDDQVTVEGDSRSFSRRGSSGAELTNFFCPTCGTTVFWRTALHPDGIGVAVGCFADPAFPAPLRSVWEATRHHWVAPCCTERFVGASSGARVDQREAATGE